MELPGAVIPDLAHKAEIRIKTADKDELKGVDLMAPDCPVKYIITINALKEGWDNPNVFQICNLREMNTERERRQTIGRGLRLAVYIRNNFIKRKELASDSDDN